MKYTYIALSVLVISFIYAFYSSDQSNSIKIVICKNNAFSIDDHKSDYAYLYSIMFLGCKLKSDNKSKEYLPYFYDTSTGHLLSISGLHIGSLALLVFVLVNSLFCLFLFRTKINHIPYFYFSIPVMIIVSIVYVCFIGIEIPRLRALIMLLLGVSSMYIPLFRNKMLILIITASLILLTMPDSVYSYSFYYSFVAVFAIFISPSKSTLVMCMSIYLFLMPINLHSSGIIDVSNILCNAVVIPFFSFIYFPLEILGIVMFFAGFHEVIIVMDRLTDVLIVTLEWLSKLSGFIKIRTYNITIEELLALYVLLISMFFAFKFYKRISKRTALYIYTGTVFLSLVVCMYIVNEYGKNRIMSFEIKKPFNFNGSGDNILIEVKGKSIVVDTGYGGKGTFDFIKEIKRRKIRVIDYLIITHSDVDHAGGVKNFLESRDLIIKNILVSTKGRQTFKNKTTFVCKGSMIDLGKSANIKFINPSCNSQDANINNNALSFLLRLGGFNFLFSSDVPFDHLQKNIEPDIVTKNLVYQLSHHCSKKDNSINFMSYLKPLFGFCTRDSHLLKSAVKLSELKFPVMMTGVCGDIQMDVSDAWLTVITQRCNKISLRINDS